MPLLFTPVVVLGLIVGSFLNVVIWRVPRGESVVSPRSHCPGCGHAGAAARQRPGARLAAAQGPLPRLPGADQRPLPARRAGYGAAVRRWWRCKVGLDWELPAYLYLAAIAVALALIDIDDHRLPNAIVLPSYPVVATLLLLPSIASGDWGAYLRAAIGMVVLFAFYFLLVLIYPAGMGFGDVKLAGVLGLALGYLGWAELAVGGFLGFLLGGVWAVALIVVRRAGRKSAIPFGPFMLAGALLAIFVAAADRRRFTSESAGL